MMKIIFTLLLLPLSLFADIERICKVSYLTEKGYSEGVPMKVVFATGKKMNDFSDSFDYDHFGHYAVLRFDDDKVAILKIEDVLIGVGNTFKADDFKNQFRIISEKKATQVNGRGGRKWKIEAKDLVRWIDPRVR